jgi:hypothetical protein
MNLPTAKDDLLTLAAIGLMAMCVVTFDHEALGHGCMCLALGGHIQLLTSSLFRCDLRSKWIAPAGPAGNLIMGTLALILGRFVPPRRASLRLFLILVTTFSYLWESGYVIQAMHRRDGDLYFAGQDFLGEPSLWWRMAGAAVGLLLYVTTIIFTARALLQLWPQAALARRAARTVWFAAAVGTVLAALTYRGAGFQDVHDAFMEIGLATFPLLLIPLRSAKPVPEAAPALIVRNPVTMAMAVAVLAAFTLTLGRGLG